jgi:hypothetical protein
MLAGLRIDLFPLILDWNLRCLEAQSARKAADEADNHARRRRILQSFVESARKNNSR